MGKSCAVAPSGNAIIDLVISMLRNFSIFHLQNPPLQSCIKAEESPFVLFCWPSLSPQLQSFGCGIASAKLNNNFKLSTSELFSTVAVVFHGFLFFLPGHRFSVA